MEGQPSLTFEFPMTDQLSQTTLHGRLLRFGQCVWRPFIDLALFGPEYEQQLLPYFHAVY
jgi:hypothetical protein